MGMERVRRIWWLALLLPALVWGNGDPAMALTVFVTILGMMGFLVWIDWHDKRSAARYVARQLDR